VKLKIPDHPQNSFRKRRVLVALLACLAASYAAAQSPDLAAQLSAEPIATMGFGSGPSVRTHSVKGHFRLTSLHANESVLVRLDYQRAFAGLPITINPLDGGTVALPRSKGALDQNGVAWMRFKVGPKPGLYRVMVLTGGLQSILKFWVDDPRNPQLNPPAIHHETGA
jgi:hypothetical protein